MNRVVASLPESVAELCLVRVGLQCRGIPSLLYALRLGRALDRAAAEAVASGAGLLHAIRFVIARDHFGMLQYWESFEAQIPGRRRSKMRRFRRRLEEQGSLSVELEHGDRGLEALLDEGFAIEGSGWKGERGTAIISSPETERFYREVAAWASERGWLRLWFLRLDGRAIAFGFCLEQGGAHYELKVGFDPAHASFGPGVILTQARLEHSFSAGLGSYEFLGQPERHKLDWTETCRELARLQLFAPTLAGHGSRLAWTHGRRLALEAIQRGRAVGERAKQVRSQE